MTSVHCVMSGQNRLERTSEIIAYLGNTIDMSVIIFSALWATESSQKARHESPAAERKAIFFSTTPLYPREPLLVAQVVLFVGDGVWSERMTRLATHCLKSEIDDRCYTVGM